MKILLAVVFSLFLFGCNGDNSQYTPVDDLGNTPIETEPSQESNDSIDENNQDADYSSNTEDNPPPIPTF